MGKKKHQQQTQPSLNHKTMMLRWFLILTVAPSSVISQSCQGDIAYEKMTNIAAPGVNQILLMGSDEQPVSKDCLLLCRQTPDCLGFNLNYTNHECRVFSFNEKNKIQKSSLMTSLGNTLYRKMCLPSGTFSKCNDHPWVIERVLNSYMDEGAVDDEEPATSNDECAALCISSKMCRSATYEHGNMKCMLHRDDRRTKPTSFHTKENDGREYLENQCLDTKSASCHYRLLNDTSVSTKDALTSAKSQSECQHACDKNTRTICRSFSFDESTKLCYLSGDDVISLHQNATSRHGSVYGERKCVPENCTGGPSAFERVTGKVLRSASSTEDPQPEDLSTNLTSKCLEQCRDRGFSCVGVIIDYINFICQFLSERNTGSTFTDFAIAPGASYFERVCLTAIPTPCLGRTWMFDRVPGSILDGLDDKILKTLSRSECEDACLKERSFICRSAEFNSANTVCRLSREDRRTRPDAFKAKSLTTDYLENQCLSPPSQCTTDKMNDAFPMYIDAIKHNVTSDKQCVDHCLRIKKFTCRAVGYRPSSRDCLLSSVDEIAGGKDSIQPRPETTYLSTKCKIGSQEIQMWTTMAPIISTQVWPNKPKPTGVPPPWVPTSGRCRKDQFGAHIYVKTPGFALSVEEISFSTFTAAVPGFTGECRRRCDLDMSCTGFTVDYVQLRCRLHGTNTQDDFARQKLVRAPSSAYFEIMCVKAIRGCNRLWTFDRFLDKTFIGIVSETLTGISKIACLETCLAEKRFTCRSVSYNRFRGECRLTTEDRFSQPDALVDAAGTDYYENQCAGFPLAVSPRDVDSCDIVRRRGKMLRFAEKSATVLNQDECEQECYSTTDFTCRSFSFVDKIGECLLSSTTADELQMELVDKTNAIYVERMCHKPFRSVLTDVQIQTCTAAGFSMERTVGVSPKFKKIVGRMSNSSTFIGMSKDCVQRCSRQGKTCMAFVQRLGNPCVSFRQQIDRKMLATSPGAVYFEKICLRAMGCGKLWTFDRLIGFELSENYVKRVHVGVSTRAECQELCLQEGAFVCRSATYHYPNGECRLYSSTRHSIPNSHQHSTLKDVDYLENQCASRN